MAALVTAKPTTSAPTAEGVRGDAVETPAEFCSRCHSLIATTVSASTSACLSSQSVPHLHIHVVSPMRSPGVQRYVAAAELGSGEFVNPVVPEDAAAALRGA